MRPLLRHFLPALVLVLAACDQQPVGIPVGRDNLPWHTLAAFPAYTEAGPVWASSADDVYLAYVTSTDRDHSLLHFDGTSWLPVDLPRDNVTGIWGSGPAEVYVALGGELQHFDGTNWTTVPDVPAQWVRGSGPGAVYTVGSAGVYYFDGNSWEHLLTSYPISAFWAGPGTTALASVHSGGPDSLFWWDGVDWSSTDFPGRVNALWGEDADHIVAVGVDTLYNSAIWTWNGSVWNAETVPAELPRLYDVAGSGPDNIFASGDYGTLLHFDGVAWDVVDVPTVQDLRHVWTYAAGSGYVTGGGGTVLASDGAAWENAFGSVNVYRTLWAEDENTFIVGSADYGINVFENGTWHHELIKRYGRVRAIGGWSRDDLYAALDYYGVYHYDGLIWTSVLDSLRSVIGMHVLSNGDVCVVDDEQGLFLFDRTTWTRIPLPLRPYEWDALWASALDDVWMILEGNVAHYDGDSTRVFTKFGNYNEDVWGNGPGDVFFVGRTGIMHFDGTTFRTVGPRQSFGAVVTGNGRVFAAGRTQAYFDRGFWHQVLEPSQDILFLTTAVDGTIMTIASPDGETITIQQLPKGEW